MITNAELVSRVVNNLKGLSKDSRVSRRFVLSIAKTKLKFLLTQKLDEMTLFREDDIITNIECFRLKELEVKKCSIFEFRICKNIMKSCEKLPEGFFGKNGSGIILIQNVEGTKRYDYISPRQYQDLFKRSRFNRGRSGYYYIKDGYLYLLDTTNELVSIQMFTVDKEEADELCDCKDSKKECRSKWDSKFPCPDRLLDYIITGTLQEVASIYRTSPEDENPNMDDNQKSQTVR